MNRPQHQSTDLHTLLAETPQLWRGREPNRRQRTLASGHARLDAQLPGGGWPLGAVTELITATPGLGEFSLLFPALAEISRNGQWLILVDPPWIPYPATLHGHGLALERLLLVRSHGQQSAPRNVSRQASRAQDKTLWACEQALHGSQGGAVLAWPQQASFARLRRLQLAAEANGKLAFVFCPESALQSATAAALRLHLHGAEHGTRIDILKCRGKRPSEPIWLPRPQARRSRTSAVPDSTAHAAPQQSITVMPLQPQSPLAPTPPSPPHPG